jgi:hypothetical protein
MFAIYTVLGSGRLSPSSPMNLLAIRLPRHFCQWKPMRAR